MDDFRSVSDAAILVASAVTGLATVVIAVYAIFSHRLAKRIEKQSRSNQERFHELLLSMASATLVSGRTVGEPDLATRLFKSQREQLRKEIENVGKS